MLTSFLSLGGGVRFCGLIFFFFFACWFFGVFVSLLVWFFKQFLFS